MSQVSVINTISVPEGMEAECENIRDAYVEYFKKKAGFVNSTFYKSIERQDNGNLQYVNVVVWESLDAFNEVVNDGFENDDGKNSDGYKVLGRGFPEPIVVSPGRYLTLSQD